MTDISIANDYNISTSVAPKSILIVLGFNDTSTLVGHFVLSPREMEKREEIVEEMKERDRAERRK